MRTADPSTDEIYTSVRPSLMSISFLSGSCAQPEQSIEDVYIAMPEPWSNGLDFFDGGYSNAQSIAGEQSLEGGCVPMLEPWSDDPDFFDASYSNVQPISAEQPTEEVVQAMGHLLTLCPMEVIRPHCKFQQTSL